ncbi:MAG: hypothetical protein IT428_30035 [Planctomycetaceae bacterium]|nr:hypothetical protein [Planctomycetaceae bacterium]
MPTRRVVLSIILALAYVRISFADSVDSDLAVIAKSGPNGAGATAAREAAGRLRQAGVSILPRLLVAMDTPNVVAANWYRSVFDPLVQKELAAEKHQLPKEEFVAFVKDGRRQGRARRLVLDVLDRLDPAFRATFIPSRLDDPEFREEAVATVLAQGDEAKKRDDVESAKRLWSSAFRAARTSDQLTTLAARLKSAGEKANVTEQMGFVVDWRLLGPFDAPGKTGFAKTFPPETAVDLNAEYPGKSGEPIRWKPYHIPDPLGQADLIKAIAAEKEAVGYAYAEIRVENETKAQVRCGADDNISVWLNGERAFAREQWLNGTRLDRFVAPVTLKAGVNRVLVKICQGPQHSDPEVPNNWSFQLRFCDAEGLGVRFTPVE